MIQCNFSISDEAAVASPLLTHAKLVHIELQYYYKLDYYCILFTVIVKGTMFWKITTSNLPEYSGGDYLSHYPQSQEESTSFHPSNDVEYLHDCGDHQNLQVL